MFHDDENEQALLGACLRDYQNVVPKAMAILSPGDFYLNFHQDTYGAILALFSQQKAVNSTTVMTALKKAGKSYNLGQFQQLSTNCPAVAGAEDYALRVKDCALRRGVIAALYQIQMATEKQESIESILTLASQKVNALIDEAKGLTKGKIYWLQETLSGFIDELEKNFPDGISAKRQVKVNMGTFDNLFGGLRKGSLIYLGGRPSMGKSTIALQWALNIARAGGTVFFCSFEIGKIEFQAKLISLQANLPGDVIDFGPISDFQMQEITRACSLLPAGRIRYTDTSMTVQEIALEAQQIRDRYKALDVIFIDRIEMVKDRMLHGENRNLQLSRISAGLNRLAVEMDIPIVCLVQLSRQAARRGSEESHRPMLSDLRDSGSLEQDAKMVMFVHREEMYSRKIEHQGKAQVIVSKSMFGPTGCLDLDFKKEIPAFYEQEKNHIEDKDNDDQPSFAD